MNEIFGRIAKERGLQDMKWGANRNLPNMTWMAVLTEEVGECARDILEGQLEHLEIELVQVAAVCVAWLEDLERERHG